MPAQANTSEVCFVIPPALRDAVKMFWQMDRTGLMHGHETIVPKGVVEIIFNLSAETIVRYRNGAGPLTVPRVFLNGFNTAPFRIALPAHQRFLGIVLHPTAVKRIFGFPARECADWIIDLSLVDRTMNTLWHEVIERPTFTERRALLVEWMVARHAQPTARECAMDRFLGDHASQVPTVVQLADRLCWSTRQLTRRMEELTAMNTERTLHYMKHVGALHLIHLSPMPLTAIAYASGFADQAHFNRSFKAFTGYTPMAYRQAMIPMVGHLMENVR
ncbi:MAG: helix-turn-helix transcriptional regulator [Bacteroidetes bacterium]|jgi:AraC-like DNA-binding protein|nr:helix-turn-helix transcriptional regulator [Bacteroidota bacterium]MBX7128951.1 AraC family transcriptional regulator [Flavobacteriales bacterium]HMW96456.1 AraC family transcriptional regulator [Flavobacteriales bacterium]HMZ48226.1 AraC family transcriptional regulator [Flavobacteriales bacterium]HNK68506.1 AraC family transcriptional regulator [Flavobacteriales bacterium]